jgi:hypothetical protein
MNSTLCSCLLQNVIVLTIDQILYLIRVESSTMEHDISTLLDNSNDDIDRDLMSPHRIFHGDYGDIIENQSGAHSNRSSGSSGQKRNTPPSVSSKAAKKQRGAAALATSLYDEALRLPDHIVDGYESEDLFDEATMNARARVRGEAYAATLLSSNGNETSREG